MRASSNTIKLAFAVNITAQDHAFMYVYRNLSEHMIECVERGLVARS